MQSKYKNYPFCTLQNSSLLIAALIIVCTTLTAVGCVLLPESADTAGAAHIATPSATQVQIDESLLLETDQAHADQVNREHLLETAVALATSQAPQPGSQAPSPTSAQTSPSPESDAPERMPADVPMPGGNKENLFSSANFLSYSTEDSFAYLTSFYEISMGDYGWVKIDAGSYITESTAQFVFEKPDRKATVNIQNNTFSERVTVVITIHTK